MKVLLGLIWLATLTYSVWTYITPQNYSSQARTIGTLTEFKGDVFFRRPYQSIWQSVLKGSEFSSGTFISTGKGSEAKIEMEGQYTVHIPEDSQISLDLQSGNKNELVLNILSGEIAVTKPKKAKSTYIEAIASRYSEITSEVTPISVASAGSTYSLTQEVSKAQFKVEESGVSLVYSDGKIKNIDKKVEIAATTTPLLIPEEPSIGPNPQIALDNEKDFEKDIENNLEQEKKKEMEEERPRSIEIVKGQLATLKAKLVSKPFSFVRLFSGAEAKTSNVLLSFTGDAFPSQYQYQLVLSGMDKNRLTLQPTKTSGKQLTYQLSRSKINSGVREAKGDLKLSYQLYAVALESAEELREVIDQGVIQFIDFKKIALPMSTLNLHYYPVSIHDEEWHPRFGQGTNAPLIAFEFSDSRLLPNLLKNSFKNFVFSFSKPIDSSGFGTSYPGTIFIRDNSPVLVSSKILDSEKVLDIKKDLDFDFAYNGFKSDFFPSGRDLQNVIPKNTSIEFLYFTEASLQVPVAKGLTSLQLGNFFRQLDQSFLVNNKPILNQISADKTSMPRGADFSSSLKRLTVIEYLANGRSAVNSSKFENLFFGFELTSSQIIKANFVANSLNMEELTADPTASEKTARFILGLNQSDYVLVLKQNGETQDVAIMWQKNAVLQKALFKGINQSEIPKTIENFLGFDCLATSDSSGKVHLIYAMSTKSDQGMYIWRDSQKLDRLSPQFLSQETPVLAFCEQSLKAGCYARIIPQIAFNGVQKCSSFDRLKGVPTLAH